MANGRVTSIRDVGSADRRNAAKKDLIEDFGVEDGLKAFQNETYKKELYARAQQSQQPQGTQPLPPTLPVAAPVPAPVVDYATTPNGLAIKVKRKNNIPTPETNPTAASASSTAWEKLFNEDLTPNPTGDPNFIAGASNQDALAGTANWTDVSVQERKDILSNPKFYENNDITKYQPWMQQQILSDPAFDWDQVPAWHKTFFEISSNPKIMASPMALAGAHAGSMFGLPGKAVGAAAGYTLGLVGGQAYDPTKGISEQPTATAKAMRILNVLSEYAEQGAGYVGQVADAAIAGAQGNEQAAQAAKDMLFDPITREAAFEAGRLTYEYADFGGRVISNLMQMLSGEKEWAESGEDFVLGASGPVDKVKARGTNPLTGEEQYYTDVMQVLLDTRKEIEAEIRAGGNPDEIVMRRLNEAAVFVGSQTQDLALQSVADPLEYLPKVTVNIGARVADIKGNKVAAEALRTTNAPIEAAQKYKNLVQTGQALTIDPSYQIKDMSFISRWIAGINKEGEVRKGNLFGTSQGLLDPVSKQSRLRAFVDDMTTQTPHSRAQTGAGMFYENIGTLLTMFEDPHEAAKYLQALSKGDNETWSQLGSRFAESPEFYTVLPALKAFATEKLDGVVQSWDMTTVNREMLLNLSNILGEEASKLVDDLAKRGTSEQDYARIMDRLKTSNSPEARALLAEAQAGRFTVETLKQTVDIFSGEGALPWHPGEWKALMLDTLGSHFDEWVSKRLMLDKSPEAVSAFFRTTALMKQAQSILLLGGSPGYAITNGLSNMVHRAATGIYGYLTPTQINTFMDRMGVNPARFEEGVGIGGQVEMKTGSGPNTTAIDKAIKSTGALTTAKDRLGKISKWITPFAKLSSWFEKSESRQAFSIAMKQFWSASWRRGVGFSKMSPDLVKVIGEMGIQPDRIYAAIEAGLNQAEIEKVLYGRFEGVQARSLVHDAAQKTGMTAASASQLLDQIGVLDILDAGLKNKTTPDGVRAVFERVNKQAQDWADMQTGADLKAMAEAVKQRVGLEGATAALDVAQHATSTFVDTWLDHYSRFGEVMNDLSLLDNPDMRNKAIDFNYQISDEEFRRVYARHAANYQGIFEAWGMSGNPDALTVLAAIGESDVAMRDVYRQMREIRKGHLEKYRNDFDNPAKWDEWDADTRKIDNLFKQAFAAKHAADVKMGASLGKIYESLYGPAAGEAARQWWEDVVKLNEEIVKREQDFRGEIAQARRAGTPKELIEARKQEYYSKTKLGMIVEVERINGEGIARLERVIKGSGGSGQAAAPTQPAPQTPPTPAAGTSDIPQPESVAVETPIPPRPASIPNDDINAMLIAAEQRMNTEAAEIKARESQIWDVAEGYWGYGSNYSREVFQHYFLLLAALRDPAFGGMKDLTGLKDPRLTPELVQAVLDARQLIHDVGIVEDVQGAVNNVRAPRINDNTTILRAISEHGGINKTMARDLTGEKRPKTAPGVFTNRGIGIDEMAIRLADDGYPIDVNDPNDPGGIAQATELNRARKGDKIYPIGHDHEAALSRAQDAAATKAFEESIQEVPFDQTLWQADFADTIARADLTRMYELIGEFPEDLSASLTPEGETFADFMSRVADETAARVEIEAREEAVATHAARAQEATQEAATRAEAVTTRNLLKEKFQDVFGLSDEQAQTYMELSDAVAGWYEKVTGENADAFYTRYYADVVKVEGDEAQRNVAETKGIDPLFQDAYHGSPYKFDQFTLDHIGTGEGAQAYGWGLYFAGDKSVAEWYRTELSSDKGTTYKGLQEDQLASLPEYGTHNFYAARDVLKQMIKGKTFEESLAIAKDYFLADPNLNEAAKQSYADAITELKKDDFKQNNGQLYKVEIPDENYLMWDKPLSEQNIPIDDILASAANTAKDYRTASRLASEDVRGRLTSYSKQTDGTGQTFYHALVNELGSDKAASLVLKDAGINGIRYYDGNSRGDGNSLPYVVAVSIDGEFRQNVKRRSLASAQEYLKEITAKGWAGEIKENPDINYNYVIFDNAAIQVKETFYQNAAQAGINPKGAVTFDADGIKATIHAFEAGDFSTLIHENAHVFRRMLADVAERSNNPYIKADLATIEEWAGVKNGEWNRAAEEKFARGFESYIADGKAPTPALVKAFEGFKQWMLEIYKTITGSAIDIQLTDDVRRVFDRMLGADNLRVDIDNMLLQMNYDPKLYYVNPLGEIVRRPKFEISVDAAKLAEDVNAMDIEGMQARARALRERMASGAQKVNPPEAEGSLQWQDYGNEGNIHYPNTRYGNDLPIPIENVRALSQWTNTQTAENQPQQFNADRNGQTDMFGQGEDMPLFSGSTMGARAETYAPKVENRQSAMFDMRPEFGAKVKKNLEKIQANRQKTDGGAQTLFQTADPVESPAFQNWFGGSKVVDENGRPLVVYHGTKADFTEFNIDKFGQTDAGWFGKGFYFTPDKEQAGIYATGDRMGNDKPQGNVMPVYIKAEKPFKTYEQAFTQEYVDQLRSEGYDAIFRFENRGDSIPAEIVSFESTQIKSKFNRGTFDPANPNMLFQEADQPFGAYDAASQFHPESEVMDAGWAQYVRPLMDAMQDGAIKQLADRPLDGATRDLSPEGQAMLKTYMRQVQNEMATTKLATIRHGEQKRDFAMLNYSKRYGFDRVAEVVYPYQFYQSRTMVNWFLRAIDKPALFSNYARLHNQMNRYERDIPERLRNKIKIPAPWLPEWAGDSLYIDPLGSLFPPATLLKPIERMMQDTTYQQIETERILQEWAEDERYSQTEIQQAAQTRSGTIYERAAEEAKLRREPKAEINNPLDFMDAMFGKAWYLTTPYKLATGKGSEVNSTPMYNTIRGIDTVTQGTWAEPVGDLIGLLGKPEEWARKKLNLPEFGEYGDYYIDRQLANMVAEGSITSEQANIAMIERQGDFFDQARERVKMELALRVPTMGALYATLNEGAAAGAQAFLPSMFGSGLLPAGELEYRGLKQEWNEAWSQVDKGNKGAINLFFEEHPEYEAYLAKGKPPEERLRSFLIGQIWDGYMELGDTNKKQARAEMGELFAQAFLNKETRSYDTLDVDTLTQWAQMLGQMVPKVPTETKATAESTAPIKDTPKLDLLDKNITDITDQFFEQRATRFPNYYEQQAGYYALPRSEQAAYLLKNPEYADYVEWRNNWYDAYPQYKPIFNGDAFDRVDTSTWPPMLEDFVRVYAMTGQKLPSGAYKSLEQVWIEEGQPMGDFKSWLNSTVVPSMLYGNQGAVQ